MCVWTTWILAFHMPRDHSHLTLHNPFGVLYKEPLGYIEEEELRSKKNLVHCCCSLLVLDFASLCPLEHLVFFPILCFFVSLLSRYGGLRWWRPMWRTQFFRFVDVPTEVATYVISDLLNRNIFSCPMICIQMNIESMDVFNCLCIIDYICRVGLTLYYIACFPCLLLLRVNC